MHKSIAVAGIWLGVGLSALGDIGGFIGIVVLAAFLATIFVAA